LLELGPATEKKTYSEDRKGCEKNYRGKRDDEKKRRVLLHIEKHSMEGILQKERRVDHVSTIDVGKGASRGRFRWSRLEQDRVSRSSGNPGGRGTTRSLTKR